MTLSEKLITWTMVGLFLVAVSGCSSARVLVQDCQELEGMPGQLNCELIREM
jgi:hypothetical protein